MKTRFGSRSSFFKEAVWALAFVAFGAATTAVADTQAKLERLLQTGPIATGCITFNYTNPNPDKIATLHHFNTTFDTEDCLQVTVHRYDKASGTWSIMCVGSIPGAGAETLVTIPVSMCTPATLVPDETMTFRIEYVTCNADCQAPCGCDVPQPEEVWDTLEYNLEYEDETCSIGTSCSAAAAASQTMFPTISPSKTPTANPTANPSPTPTKIPTTPSPTTNPTSNPSPTPTKNPTTSPTAVPTTSPTNGATVNNCVTTYSTATNTFGELTQCSKKSDCGGIPPDGGGASCNLDTCQCECDEQYCLSGPAPATDGVCAFDCTCKDECDILGAVNGIPTGNNNYCSLTCVECTSDPVNICGQDQDCIFEYDNKGVGTAFCVESGLCTAAKNVLCDEGYEAVSGNNNNRAKCCPSTSGCIKITFGVTSTSTCGNNCGTSCLDANSNPGNYGYSPVSFCTFGSRVDNMPYCPEVAAGSIGDWSCTEAGGGGNTDQQGDNSICCHEYDGISFPLGEFDCTTPTSPETSTFGPIGNSTCVDEDALTYISGRMVPLCLQ